MNTQELHDFKKRLERMHEDLRADADSVRDNAKPIQLDQASVGRLSRMDAMQGQAMAIETRRRWNIQLQRIELALVRIASGDYGTCQSCEEDIDPRRLKIDPTAPLCTTCASVCETS